MAKVHPGATLVPHFREFLPAWVARQPWYEGEGVPSLSPVGYFRFEDPAGEVGLETHLVTDGAVLYQIPMSYRGAPIESATLAAPEPLIATTEHSVLGTRWIYDGTADPVWVGELLRLVRAGAVSEPSSKRGVGPAEARGHLLAETFPAGAVTLDLRRTPCPGPAPDEREAIGLVMGTWHPHGSESAPATGCLAVIREAN